ncbi:MAG TPA: squalene/phytoene synthase family protein [Candidatus Poseidoniales archaeon]|mgnify:CR=1 FL=1|nr:MAG TPA: squalene/phytoene synthase family protein [Candidatus Poseidoniales archaeon]
MRRPQHRSASRTDRSIAMSVIVNDAIDDLLRRTSRSFYLSLGTLPDQIRNQVGLLYLLARVADTIADTGENPDLLIGMLDKYSEAVQSNSDDIDLNSIADLQENHDEGDLLRSVSEVISAFAHAEEGDREMILRCLLVIISGQRLDIERFGTKSSEIRVLESDKELDDYAYRVAGSVGEFWTEISFNRLIEGGTIDIERMLVLGVRFGKALQMINILRDIPSDLSIGRCYIPKDRLSEYGLSPTDLLDSDSMGPFRDLYSAYLDLTCEHLDYAEEYISIIPRKYRSLRLSCLLPVVIGRRTIALLRGKNVLNPGKPIKIGRRTIALILFQCKLAVRSKWYEKRLISSGRIFSTRE